jgi:hypothetical protein
VSQAQPGRYGSPLSAQLAPFSLMSIGHFRLACQSVGWRWARRTWKRMPETPEPAGVALGSRPSPENDLGLWQ